MVIDNYLNIQLKKPFDHWRQFVKVGSVHLQSRNIVNFHALQLEKTESSIVNLSNNTLEVVETSSLKINSSFKTIVSP
jgi:hypothetical protein